MTEEEKSYWRIYASLQELLRVTDEDVANNPDLRQLIEAFTNVARVYRAQGPETVRIERHLRRLEETGIPVIRPKKPPNKPR